MSAPNVITPVAGLQAVRPMAPTRIGFNGATYHRDLRHGLNGHGWGPQVSLTRTTDALYEDDGGTWRIASSGVARIRNESGYGLLVEEEATNKCTNYNAEPDAGLTNLIKTGDAAATLTRVTDAAALAVVGLDTEVCTSTYVFKLDNSGGATPAYAQIVGATGNVNTHSWSVFMRSTGGVGRLRNSDSSIYVDCSVGADYARLSVSGTPVSTSDYLGVTAVAGAIVYFVLNQLEELTAATTPIITTGASATRNADLVTWPYAGTMADEFSVVCVWRSAVATYTGYKFLWEATLADGERRQMGFVDQKVQGGVQSGAVWSALFNDPSNFSLGVRNVTGMSARANDFRLFHNGSQVASDTSGPMPLTTPTIHRIANFSNAQQPNAWIESLTLYPDALPQAVMEGLTA